MAQSSFNGFTQPKKDGGNGAPSFYAEGTITDSSTLLTFYWTSGSGSGRDKRYITVSGLNFPLGIKRVEIFALNGIPFSYFNISSLAQNISDANIVASITVLNPTAELYRLDGVNAYVNNNGFRLPTGTNINDSVQTYRWRAWG
jgi:hypothetical protein